MNQTFPAGTTLTFYFENDDADGQDAQKAADELNSAGFGALYWDLDGNDVLDGNDFDINGDGNVDLGTGDYSPLGLVITYYNGDPGNPVGSGPGILVHTYNVPPKPIESFAYSIVYAAPADFNYFIVESVPDGIAADPRLIEIELNGIPNVGGSFEVLRPWCGINICDCV